MRRFVWGGIIIALIALGLIAALLLLGASVRADETPTPTPTLQPTTQIFVPAIGGGPRESPATPSVLPPAWRSFLRRYGSPLFLIIALALWAWLRWRRQQDIG
ncbi:MAG: hypothetical protein ACLFTI_12140 [Anaerolineales bacterium]